MNDNGRNFNARISLILIVVLALALASLAWSQHYPADVAAAPQPAQQVPAAPRQPAGPEANLELANRTFVELAEQLKPTVVFINVVKTVSAPTIDAPFAPDDPFWDFFRDLVPPDRDWRSRGLGSGFIIDPAGFIVTNFHVVDSAQTITVKLLDGRELEGRVVGADRKTDLALIKVESETPLAAIPLGDSDALKVGEWVIAIGAPLGLDYTVTAGIVSAKGRVIGAGPYDDFIQTDASINPGNSGGPLINIRGEAVGVNTLILQGGQNLGFAIPINMARDIAGQIRDKGHVVRGWLGIEFAPLERQRLVELKAPAGAVQVSSVMPGGPAERGGLQAGDVLVEFNGRGLSEVNSLPRLVAATPVGAEVKLAVLRDGARRDLDVTIAEMPPDGQQTAERVQLPWGLTVSDLTPDAVRRFGPRQGSGALVVEVQSGSAAAKTGVQPGDLIYEVERIRVMDVASLKAIIDRAKRGDNLLFVLDRRGETLRATLRK